MFISAAAYRLIQSGIALFYANQEQYSLRLIEQLPALPYEYGLYDSPDIELEAQDYDKTLFAGGLILCLFWVRTAYMARCICGRVILYSAGCGAGLVAVVSLWKCHCL